MIVLWTALATAACPSLSAELDAAEASLQVLDLPGAAAYLDAAEAALACGPVPEASMVARFYFLDGAVAQFTGDAEAAVEAYRAARQLDAGASLPGFESAVAELVTRAAEETPTATGSVDIAPALAEPWQVRIDLGAAVTPPTAVMEGLHLVQFTDGQGTVFEGKVVRISGDFPVVVNHELPATPPEPERVRTVVPLAGTARLGFGGSFAFGESQSATVAGQSYAEPSFKAMTPASLGLELAVGKVLFEVEGELGALLDGHYLVEGDPAPEATKLGWGLGAHAGVRLGDLDVGAGGGGLFPGRYRGYALARFRPFDRAPVSLTGRAGVRSAHRLGLEPMFGLTIAYDLGLF